jgi:signal recognition particle subunit SRP14
VQSHTIHRDLYLTVSVTYDQTSSKSPTDKVPADPLVDLHPTLSLPVIIRASDGETQSKNRVKNKDHVKISTIVQPDDLEGFFTRYADVCKASMLSLRKRDRRKRKADKGKKKKGAETTEKRRRVEAQMLVRNLKEERDERPVSGADGREGRPQLQRQGS